MTSLTRLYRFSASHRLHSPFLSDRENAEIFGKCNNPYGHGHDYVLSVTVSGPVDSRTGLLVSVAKLDRLIREIVLDRFAHRNMNVDVTQFSDLVPTTENVVLVIADLLRDSWSEYMPGSAARLHRVHVQETDRNGFELLVPARQARQKVETEGLLLHA